MLTTDDISMEHVGRLVALFGSVDKRKTFSVGVLEAVEHHLDVEHGVATVLTVALTNTDSIAFTASRADVAVSRSMGALVKRAAEVVDGPTDK